MTRPHVAVLMGGPDAEYEVSLDSGRAIATALRETDRFDVTEHVIDRPDAAELAAIGTDVIFPALHGHWGEGGPLQERLDEAAIAYVGSRPTPSARCMDKLVTKTMLADAVRTPSSRQLMPDDPCDLDPPLVLKPVDEGSSVDLRICHTQEEVVAGRAELHPKRGRLLAERYIAGRELTVGILLDRPLPLIEIVPATSFYDYDAKYHRDDTIYCVDPEVSPRVKAEATAAAMTAYQRMACRDLARADFILDADGTVWFLEINTMPGFTSHSLLPQAAAHVGLDMPAVCGALVDAALARVVTPAAESR